ncbi:Predicted Zn-dependent peptidase [Clostridium sp. USBA 49]|uniref:M16 family metallopeptidase n=1 Tax=Clostridium sp. USBA 49 TaxID=1881060 RepID=UPI000999C5EF|nr:pitrilysin family protein [Clostridium sp. USBA 49]SKA72774.1 Predicted Zn-dependent peptidase [Clostridium sp. USBA 49]
MNKYILSNGIRFIYDYRPGNITSFCIGFEAGALMEEGFKLGTAHAVEHVIFKGTKNRSEYEINKLFDEIFGFNNAMTNYPYCIYYGTTLSSDFERGIELYSDIILNPKFSNEGFEEEINIICEELKKWNDDIEQYCEDRLFYNSFKKRRIKNLIIGDEKSIRCITLEDIKKFYESYYLPQNCVISVVSSLNFDEVLKLLEKYFGEFKGNYNIYKDISLYENNKPGIYVENKNGISSAKVQYIYPIHELNNEEIKILNIFNNILGQGTSSLLYDKIRTKNGLVYDIGSSIKNEKGIKLFTIKFSTSSDKINDVIKLINQTIEESKCNKYYYSKKILDKNLKSINIKRELSIERSIELSKKLTTYEIMYKDYDIFYKENDLENITYKEIIDVINKVLKYPSIQIIKPY